MEKQIEYKGYQIIGTINNRIRAIIKNNIFTKSFNEINDYRVGVKHTLHLKYEPPIVFEFKNYESMIKFIDENPK